MTFDFSRVYDLDLSRLTPKERQEVAERLFGPPPERQLADALKTAYRERADRNVWAVYTGEQCSPSPPTLTATAGPRIESGFGVASAR